MKKVLLLTLVAILAFGIFAGCAPAAPAADAQASASASAEESPAASASASAGETDASLTKIMDKGEFVMGMDVSFPPMGFKDENGELVGFDVDMAKAVAEHMGIEVKLQPIDWNSKEMELSTGSIDVIWNGYTITDERKNKVLMSEPYMGNAQVIVVKAGSDIKSLADVAGKKLGLQDGSSAQEAVEANTEFAASIGEMVKFKDNAMALLDLANGQVDAVAVDSVVADYYSTKQEGQYELLEETLAPEEYGIGFRKGDQTFHDAVMEALNKMKEDGTAAQISEKWFGRDVTTF